LRRQQWKGMEIVAQRAGLDFRADFGYRILHPLIAPKLHHSTCEQRPNLAGSAFVNRKITGARKRNRAHLEAIQPTHRTITALPGCRHWLMLPTSHGRFADG